MTTPESTPHRYGFLEHLLFPATRFNQSRLQRALAGKTVLITGASFGIGEASAQLLSACDCHLILVGRTEEKLDRVKALVIAQKASAEVLVADLNQEASVDALIATLKQRDKGVDVLIHNAGKSIRRSIYDSLDRYHDFTRTLGVNYLGPVKLSLAMIPMLLENKGHLIHISAVNTLLPPAPKWAAYQASKTAFDHWMRSVGPELRAKGLGATSIYLPLVKTRMMAPTKEYDHLPAMTPEHVANIIAKAIIKRPRKHKPWWLGFSEFGSLIFRGSWERAMTRKMKKQNRG